MRLTIYTSEKILRCLLTDNIQRTESERKYPVWVNFINTAIADIKYRPDPFVSQEEKYEVTIKDLIGSYTQKSSNLSINPMTSTEIALTCQIEDSQLEYVNALKLETSILNPRSIVILDIDPNIAQIISKRNGIICHSFSTPAEESPLFYEGRDIYFNKGIDGKYFSGYQSKFGRDRLISEFHTRPVNSVVLIDRYLCSSEGKQEDWGPKDNTECNRITYQDGWDNVVYFLCIL